VGEVDRLPASDTAFAGGQGEQRSDEPFLEPAEGQRFLTGPWAGLGVLAAWAMAALLVGALLLRLRDA
jgi:hypothetical protein